MHFIRCAANFIKGVLRSIFTPLKIGGYQVTLSEGYGSDLPSPDTASKRNGEIMQIKGNVLA
ncbi:MAG: hypothetical protein V4490_03905, partial [Pseudomonadota bacterium]